MIRRPPRSTPLYSSAASDVYKRQPLRGHVGNTIFVGGADEALLASDHVFHFLRQLWHSVASSSIGDYPEGPLFLLFAGSFPSLGPIVSPSCPTEGHLERMRQSAMLTRWHNERMSMAVLKTSRNGRIVSPSACVPRVLYAARLTFPISAVSSVRAPSQPKTSVPLRVWPKARIEDCLLVYFPASPTPPGAG